MTKRRKFNSLHYLRKEDLKVYLIKYSTDTKGCKQELIDRLLFNNELRDTPSIFDDPKDHKQFVCHLQSIERTDYIKKMKVPLAISRLIAEYATGQMYRCDQCNHKIYFLQNDHDNLIKRGKMLHVSKWDKYYCKYCMNDVIQCDGCDLPAVDDEEAFFIRCDNWKCSRQICWNDDCKIFKKQKPVYCQHKDCYKVFCGNKWTNLFDCFMKNCQKCKKSLCEDCERYHECEESGFDD